MSITFVRLLILGLFIAFAMYASARGNERGSTLAWRRTATFSMAAAGGLYGSTLVWAWSQP